MFTTNPRVAAALSLLVGLLAVMSLLCLRQTPVVPVPSPRTIPIRDRLNARVEPIDFEPGTTIREALDFFRKHHQLVIEIDMQAFKTQLDLPDPERQLVPFLQIQDLRLGTVLHLLLNGVDATYQVRNEKLVVVPLVLNQANPPVVGGKISGKNSKPFGVCSV